MPSNKLYGLSFPRNLARWLTLSADNIVEICKVSKATARRYVESGKAPYPIYKLLELHAAGRIVPETWRYCYFNTRGELILNGLGYLTENQIVDLYQQKERHYWEVRGLNMRIEKLKGKVEQLQECLDEANVRLGVSQAANDERW